MGFSKLKNVSKLTLGKNAVQVVSEATLTSITWDVSSAINTNYFTTTLPSSDITLVRDCRLSLTGLIVNSSNIITRQSVYSVGLFVNSGAGFVLESSFLAKNSSFLPTLVNPRTEIVFARENVNLSAGDIIRLGIIQESGRGSAELLNNESSLEITLAEVLD